jgi:hypothetical protein
MFPAEFEPAVSTNERPQTFALDGSATGIGPNIKYKTFISKVYRCVEYVKMYSTERK